MSNFADLKNRIVTAEGENGLFAANILCEELNRRTGMDFTVGLGGSIYVGENQSEAPAPEGYFYGAQNGRVRIVGFDRLGCIHGVGRLLRECRWGKGLLSVADCTLSTYPRKEIHGAQVGYRNKTNAYACWTLDVYRRYILDLALFGAGTIEFMPGKTDDDENGPGMKYAAAEVVTETSRYAHELGLKVWLWYPNMMDNCSGVPIPPVGHAAGDSDAVKKLNADLDAEEARREADFSMIPYIDHIMIPGGDPGSLEPEDLFTMSGRVAAILHKYHPNAGVWVSAQVMKNEESFKTRFYQQVARRPAWLTGICHAPWVSHTMAECRRRTPAQLPIRSYPDICHALCCQYPYHRMDPIWTVTAGREFYNPRPRWHRRMHSLNARYNIGCLSYSEGIADDVSKMIWLDADWDESISYMKTLRDFASMFISPDHAEEMASIIAAFENVFDGPAAENAAVKNIYTSLRQLQKTLQAEGAMPGFGADSYRFAMPMLMSAFLMLTQKRALRDKAIYRRALDVLTGDGTAAEKQAKIEAVLDETKAPADEALYREVWDLADVCWEKIYWKLSERKHCSPSYDRGGFVETIDLPLCDAFWLREKVRLAMEKTSEADKQAALCKIASYENPGPGGIYADFGTREAERFIQSDINWWNEPEAITIPRYEQYVGMWGPDELGLQNNDKVKLSRITSLLGYYDAPVDLAFDGLVPGAAYELRIVFALRFGWKGRMPIEAFVEAKGERLTLLGTDEEDCWVYRYSVPAGMVDDAGRLALHIGKEDGPRGTGVTELWLCKAE